MSLMKKLIAVLISAPLLTFCAGSSLAAGQSECTTPAEVAERLLERFDERLRSQAITSTGWLLEIYRSVSGTWTQVVYNPQGGCAYLVISGTDWTDVPGASGQPS